MVGPMLKIGSGLIFLLGVATGLNPRLGGVGTLMVRPFFTNPFQQKEARYE